MSKNNRTNYYQNKNVVFGISGDRLKKMLPLLRPVKNKTVLDVGCAGGFFGEILRRNGNYVEGWDISRRSVLQARKEYDAAKVVDLESDNWPKTQKFDLIICSEVLEHLFDPEAVIKKLRGYLNPGGQILFTTPNILHIYRRLQFLLGHFDYRDDSVINRSHLHFFTYKTFLQMLAANNLKVIKENNVIFPRTGSFIWKYLPNVFANQTVVLTRRNEK